MNDDLSLFLIRDFAVILISAAIAAWICKRINLSPIVGYLAAGILVGTPQITFIQVTDPARVQLLSQLGLIFLMFSIGLGFRLQRFKQLGVGMIIATVGTALITLTATRLVGGWIGLSQAEGLFLAAMLMVSSSAVIGKTLQSLGLTHRRFGQLAMGVTLCEDIVAIVMLAFLGSYAAIEPGADGGGWMSMATKVGMLLGFVFLLMVPGLILVPRLLGRVSRMKEGAQELETLITAGLLFGMAFLTLFGGYSLALGAFLCGMVVAESSRVRALSDIFAGIRDIFVAVFFVAIGMSIDVTQFPSAIGPILLGSALALVLRPVAATISMLLACEDPKEATKAGLCLTPIGEFSFVIAGLGASAGILAERFQIAAVGISFVTTIASPWVMQRSETLGSAFNPARARFLREGLAAYRNLWQLLGRQQGSSLIWRLLRPRIPQVAAELIFVSALLVFSEPIYRALLPRIQSAEGFLGLSYEYGYWVAVTLLALVPLVALARNINAIAMLLGEYLTQGLRGAPGLRRALILLFRGLGLLALGVWIVNLIPFSWLSGYALVGVTVATILALAFGWRAMTRLHSEAAVALREVMNTDSAFPSETRALMQAKEDWGIQLEEWELANIGPAGRSIGELQLRKRTGATIVGIERHGHYLPSIGPGTHLFSGDRLYVTGSPEQLATLRGLLEPAGPEPEETAPDYRDAILETAVVSQGATAAGKSFLQLQWPRLIGAQAVALRRGDSPPRPPEATDTLQPGDALLLVGTPKALATALEQLAPPAAPASAAS